MILVTEYNSDRYGVIEYYISIEEWNKLNKLED